MNDTVFREYDIRGKVGSDFLLDEVYDLTSAIIYYFTQQQPGLKTIIVGMDGRIHSQAIKQEMCKALTDSGIEVISIGICTTPVLYFALHTVPNADGGLMITASHNAKEYNGIKLCLGTRSVWGTEIQDIKRLYKERKKNISNNSSGHVREHDVITSYVQWLVTHFAHLKNSDIRAVIDCGNGAAGTVMPTLIKELGWSRVELLYPEVDGTYPNHEADPTVEANMREVKARLETTESMVGCGLDGDADRMAAMTKNGYLIPGDQLLTLFAHPVINSVPGAIIVYDIKSSSVVAELIEEWGGHPIMSPCGHSIVKEYMRRYNAILGGELSCHFFFKDRYFGYDDGVYALLRLFELIHQSGNTLEELLEVFPRKYTSPEFRIFCEEARKSSVIKALGDVFRQRQDAHITTIDGVRVALDYGWGLVRPSNTQPALSIRFESNTADGLQRIKQDFIDALQPHMPATDLMRVFSE